MIYEREYLQRGGQNQEALPEQERYGADYVCKFGGSSVGSIDGIKSIVGITERYRREGQSIVIVASALGGVTDKLVDLHGLVVSRQVSQAESGVCALRQQHVEFVRNLPLDALHRQDTIEELDELFSELYRDVGNTSLPQAQLSDRILAYGEQASVRILASGLGICAQAIDATRIVRTDDVFGNASIDRYTTRRRIQEELVPLIKRGIVPVVSGFVGATADGTVTTLGRNTSDYSAAMFAPLLPAREVHFYKDVPGIRDAEGVYFEEMDSVLVRRTPGGTKVIHEKALDILDEAGIPARVKCTFRPEAKGTLIMVPSQGI